MIQRLNKERALFSEFYGSRGVCTLLLLMQLVWGPHSIEYEVQQATNLSVKHKISLS